jgi:5-formyltetrahydrofolate cyclo-ligase
MTAMPQTPADAPAHLAQWRTGMRAELIARRLAAPAAEREAWSLEISLILLRAVPWRERLNVGFCWPHKGEYDARPLLRSLRERGMQTALPVIEQRNQPMIFRLWSPAAAMEEGPLGIPRPVGTAQVVPDVLLAPMVGFGRSGDRLGYGGGYFDRTLAALEPRPLCIGVGFELSQVDSIFPQPYDVPMDAIVTEAGARWRELGQLKPVGTAELRERLSDLSQVRDQLARLNAHTVPGSLT